MLQWEVGMWILGSLVTVLLLIIVLFLLISCKRKRMLSER